ncbi:UNVERIFIED_ORG: hypothetical protein B2H98_08090 [Clostridium botulinum]
MNRKFLSALLATAAVVSLAPTTEVYAASTVSASSNAVQVTANTDEETPISIFDVSILKDKNKFVEHKPQGYSTVLTGSNSDRNKDGVHSYDTYYALLAVPGTKVTFVEEARDTRNYVSVDSTSIYNQEKRAREDTQVSFSFIMPSKTKSKISITRRGPGRSDSRHYDYYNVIPLVGIETGNPTSEQAVSVQQAFLNYTANNNTKISDFQNLANSIVDTSKYTVSVSQTDNIKATESKMGVINGTVKVSSNDGKKTEFSFSSPISRLAQSANTIMENYKNSIENFRGTNSTNQNDVLNIVKKTNDDISVNISKFKKIDATDKADGKITGTLNITGVEPYDFIIEIPRLAQSTDTAKTILESVIENMSVSNDTNEASIQKLVNNSIDTTVVKAKVEITDVKKATETTKGSIVGNISISDNTGTTANVSINKVIEEETQSTETVKNLFETYLKNMKATNTTIESDLLKGVLITNQDIEAKISNFNKVDSTDKVEGKITGTLNITGVEPYDFIIEIPRLAQSTDTAREILESVVENMNVTNSTDKASIQKLVNNSIDTTVVKANVEITNVKKATETTKGSITGNILIEDKTGAKATIQINKVIEEETQSLNTVKDLYKLYLDSMEKTNNTTEKNILDGVHITNESIEAKISDFNVIKSTETTKGAILGNIAIKDNDSNEEATVPINLTIDYLHQSVATVAKLYVEAAKTYIPSNATTEQDIIDMISIVNKDIKVVPDSFKLVPATDESKGKVSINLTISDAEKSIVQPIQITINNQAQELSTALAETQKFLAGYKNTTNDIDMDDLLIKINDVITNPSIFASYSNAEGERIEKVKATEDSKGYVKGSLLIADSKGHKVKVPVSFEIEKLSQSLDTAEKKVNEYLNSLKANNELKESDVLFNIQNVLDKDIKVTIEDYLMKESTEATKGSVTGKVILVKDDESREIKIEKEIDLKAQSMDNVIELINSKLENMYLSNTSTSAELESELNSCLTGAEGNTIKIKVADDDFRMMKATEDLNGSIRGKITLFDSNMNIKYIPYNVKIKQLAQTLDNAANKVNDKLNNLKADNNLTKEAFTEDMKSVITNAEGSKIIILTDKFELTKATEKTLGKLIVEVTVLDGSSSKTLEKTLEIAKTNQSVDEAQDTLDKVLPKLNVDNNTKLEDIINQIKDAVGDNINVEIKDFNKTDSTNKENGKITGTIVITDNKTGETIEIPLDISIPKLEETLDEAQDTLDKVLPKLNVDNNTKPEDIINQIKDAVGDNINVEIKDFNKTDATSKENGKITGTIVITDNKTGETIEIPLDISIPKLEETLDEAHNNINDKLPSINVDNNTKPEDIINQIKDGLGNNINVEIKDFNKTDATSKNEGKITGTIVITDNKTGETIEIPLNVTIPKLDEKSNSGGSGGGSSTSSNKSHHKNNNELGEVNIDGQVNDNTFASNSDWSYKSGKWTHKSNGSYDVGWTQINEKWYYFDSNGYMLNGWINLNDSWYYLSEEAGDMLGAMQTGWSNINGTWYYLDNSGKMQTGWSEINGTWYYLDNSGKMQTGWISYEGNWYYLDNLGKMQTGWYEINGNWYFLNPISNGTKGAMQTGWISYNEGWYHLNVDGKMQTGWYEINGTWYYFNDSGLMQSDCVINGYKISKTGALIA